MEGICLGYEIILVDMGGSPDMFNIDGWVTKHTNKMCA